MYLCSYWARNRFLSDRYIRPHYTFLGDYQYRKIGSQKSDPASFHPSNCPRTYPVVTFSAANAGTAIAKTSAMHKTIESSFFFIKIQPFLLYKWVNIRMHKTLSRPQKRFYLKGEMIHIAFSFYQWSSPMIELRGVIRTGKRVQTHWNANTAFPFVPRFYLITFQFHCPVKRHRRKNTARMQKKDAKKRSLTCCLCRPKSVLFRAICNPASCIGK